MSDVTRDDLRDLRETIIEEMRTGFGSVNERLDILNGRTRRNEVDIAVLQDRSSDAKRFGGWVGAIIGTAAGILSGWLKP